MGGPAGRSNERIGYLPQRRVFDAATRVRGVDLVRLGLDGRRWGVPLPFAARFSARSRAERARVEEAIERVGAEAYAERPIGECSGGEQQRLLIAQALVREPRMLILDEPLDGLDLANQAAVAALVQRICRTQGVTVLLVAHDVNPLLPYLDRVLYLAGGRAAMGSVEEVITSANTQQPVWRSDRGAADGRRAPGRRRPARGAPPARAAARTAMNPRLTFDLPSDVHQLLAYPFMVNALEAASVVAVMAAVVGWFMVLRGETFAGHTLSMMSFPGAAAAALAGLPLAVGYFAFCGVGAVIIAGTAEVAGPASQSQRSAIIGAVGSRGPGRWATCC